MDSMITTAKPMPKIFEYFALFLLNMFIGVL